MGGGSASHGPPPRSALRGGGGCNSNLLKSMYMYIDLASGKFSIRKSRNNVDSGVMLVGGGGPRNPLF